MATFLFVYTGGEGMGENLSEAEQQSHKQAWMSFFAGLGEALVDFGGPLPNSRTVSADGVNDRGASMISGISTVTAASIEQACQMAAACPVIKAGGAVEVYEKMDTPT